MSTTFDRIQMRRGTAAEATAANPVLLAGEIGYETDTGKFKFGNGANAWLDLPYANQVGGVVGDASQLAGVAPLSVIPDLSSLYLSSDGGGTLAESQIPDLSDRYDAAGAAATVQSNLDTFKTQTASNEDLLWPWYSGQPYGSVDVAPDFVIGPAPMDMTILGLTMVWDDSNNFNGLAGSDTSWYQVALQIAGGATLVYQTTQLTGADAGGSIATEQAWNFDSRTWSSRNVTKGQVLKVVFSRGATGTNAKPTNIGMEFGLVMRYQRQVPA